MCISMKPSAQSKIKNIAIASMISKYIYRQTFEVILQMTVILFYSIFLGVPLGLNVLLVTTMGLKNEINRQA